MHRAPIAWAGESASLCGGLFRCGFVKNRLQEIRCTDMHEGLVISWLFEGSGVYRSGADTASLTPGCACLRRPDRAYTLTLDAQVDHLRYFLMLPESCYPLLCQLLPGLSDISPIYTPAYSEKLLQSLYQLLLAMRQTPDAAAYTLLPRMVAAVIALTALDEPAETQDALAQAHAMLADPAHFLLPLPEVARQAGIGYSTFRKQFQKRYGVTPGQFRLDRRMDYAKQALASGEAIAEVAEKYGFSDLYAFSKQFRAMTGETPAGYRAHHII